MRQTTDDRTRKATAGRPRTGAGSMSVGGSLSRRAFGLTAAGGFAAAFAGPSAAERLSATSRSGGFSETRLAHMADAMRGHVERAEVAGMVTLAARHDAVHVEAIGMMDLESGAPMRRDTIFRIASMTKPVTAAAAMILVEEGKIGLDDPVDRFLPELADRKVLRTLESPLEDTMPAKRAITLRDLLTLRPGIGAVMVFPSQYPIQKAMEAAGVAPSADLFPDSPEEYMKRLGGLPLVHQPGEVWMYHTGLDIAGVLVARAAGMSLGDFMAERIFTPLGMKDTSFYVPEEKLDRLATAYQRDQATGRLVVWNAARGGKWASQPAFEAGGGGLVSTVDDFHAFARMMLNSGRHGSEQILSRESVEAMTTDQITPEQKAASLFFPGFWDNRGWGLGLSMTTGPDDIAAVPGRYGWYGGYGTTYIAEAREDMVAILLMQRVMGGPDDFEINQEFLKRAY